MRESTTRYCTWLANGNVSTLVSFHVYCYYYSHLVERYAEGLHEGMPVRQGEAIGYVGTSGNAPPNTPHLHFAIFKLGPEKHWWQGTAINPYSFLIKLVKAS